MSIKYKIQRLSKSRYIVVAFVMALSLVTPLSSSLLSSTANAAALTLAGKTIKQVETGLDTACAVADGWVYCWGANDLGQLGVGTTNTGANTVPKPVSNSTTGTPAGPAICVAYFWIFCTAYAPGAPAVPPSAMAGLEVEKVSVGATHACAIASARVYCWGDNDRGQLGNNSTVAYSTVPVKVTVTGALAQKEIIDVSAGESFTCALASDGTVACWGAGDHGRLGTGSEDDTSVPKAVDVGSGSDLAGKKGIKLARASLGTMCVLAVSNAAFASGPEKGNPYCWGIGIGNGTIPPSTRVTVACNSRDALPTRPTGSGSVTTYFSSATPIEISDTQLFSQVDGTGYLTGLSDNNRAYYWGMHGYRADNTYISTTSCSVNPCTVALNKIRLAVSVKNSAGAKAKSKAQNNAKNSNKPGGDKNKNLNSNNRAQQSAQTAATKGVSSSISASGGGVRTNYTIGGTTTRGATAGTNGNYTSITYASGSYAGIARPGGATSGSQVGNNKTNNNRSNTPANPCAAVTRYGYTADRTVDELGKMTPTVPHATSLNQSTMSVLSGDIEDGLFCAVKTAGGTFCDANGTGMDEGQTGSNYTQSCVTTWYFIWATTTCAPEPTGPQQVVPNGWLSGKTLKQLSTGLSGYTCALSTSNNVGCWGLNDVGQIGDGTATNRLVPTALRLQ